VGSNTSVFSGVQKNVGNKKTGKNEELVNTQPSVSAYQHHETENWREIVIDRNSAAKNVKVKHHPDRNRANAV
jgi:hypothetical protein